ncbi:hypothetical protein B0H13DRAFT_2420907 [Mycena leptocephala]|nr:hypothetical protein B0H13DRAFT_2420907 [Mycena leptocephala]
MATFRTICPRCGQNEKQPPQLRGTTAWYTPGVPCMRGVGVEPLARMAMISMAAEGAGDGEAVVDNEPRRRALRMAVVLWSSGVWGRPCVDGSPGRRRRAEVGRGVLRGNSGDAGNGERAVKVLGMRRSERRAVTVGVGAKVPRGTEKGGAGATHGPRAAWWVCRRDGRRRIRDVGHEIDHRRVLRMGVLDRCQRALIQRRGESGRIERKSRACLSGTVGRRCLGPDERRVEMVKQSTVNKGYIERPEGLEQHYYEGDRIETHTRTDVDGSRRGWMREEMAWLWLC